MATKLEIWNMALRLIGEQPLQTLTDDVPSRYTLELAWPRVVLDGLSRGVWNFAIKSAEFAADESLTPAVGFIHVVPKPSDWLFTNVVSTFPDIRDYIQTDYTEFVDQGGNWHSYVAPLYVEYVSTDSAQDANISGWSELFVQFIGASLAFDICETLTQSTTKLQMLEQETKRRLARAKSRDAKDERQAVIRPGAWARSQRSSSFRTNRQRFAVGGGIQTREGEV